MKRTNLIGYSIIAGMVAFSSITPQVYADNIQDAKQKVQDQKNQVDSLKAEMDTLRTDIKSFEAKISANQAELTKTNKEITSTKKEIEKKIVDIQKLHEKVVIRTDILKKRMSALQKEEKTSVIVDVLVNSKNVVDLFQRVSSLDMIFQSDEKIMKQLDEDQNTIKKEKAAIETKKDALVTYENTLKTTKADLENNQAQKQQAFTSLENKMTTAVTQMEASQSQLKDLEEQALFLQSQADNSASDANDGNNGSNGNSNVVIPPATGGVIAIAQKQLGKPYVFGAAGPNAFDCSGFITYVYGVGRQDVAGFWNRATKISNPEPGDLVFFQNTYKPGPSHVGIYVGNGQMIHAGSNGIAYSNLNSSYNKSKFLGYGRF